MNIEKIKSVLGCNYASKLSKILNEHKVKTLRGKDFSSKTVQDIVHGRVINIPAMEVIFKYVCETENKLKKLSK